MHIIDISVSNFKSFEKLDKLCLTKLNMIYGLNNSGKSNLLKLVEIIFRPKENTDSVTRVIVDEKLESHSNISEGNFWTGIIKNEPFIFRLNNTSIPITFSVTIIIEDVEIKSLGSIGTELISKFPSSKVSNHEMNFEGEIISISDYDSKIKLNNVSLNKVNIFNGKNYFNSLQPTDTVLYENEEIFYSFMSLFSNCVMFLDNDRYFISEKENSKINALSPKNIKNWLFNKSMEGFSQTSYKKLISQISEFKTNGADSFKENEMSSPFNELNIEFARIGDELEIFFKNDFNTFPISNFGTGIQQIFFILIKIFYSKSKIVLIEEIELNLSPKYQLELLQFINNLVEEKRIISQLIFTTHSPLFCYRGDFSILKVSINKAGATEVKKVSRDDLKEFVDIDKLMIDKN